VFSIAAAIAVSGALAAPAKPEEAPHLPRPFTAEQIRDEWVEGLTVVMRSVGPEGESRQRWTVVDADETGAVIEFTPIDAKGEAAGAPRTERSTWNQLRDHATFAASSATREVVTRETPLGKYEGWLYRVPDPEQGTLTEFFFASELPGAPLVMRVSREGRTLMELTQVSRSKTKR
jgi:hypothetical protein